jgi:nitrate/TMAO reductase-like tetraheme cytochrome c subunit
MVSFDHNLTSWPLEGNHSSVSCRECHFDFSENNEIIGQKFSNLEQQCASCHENVHGELFEVNGITDCNRCHVTDSWYPKKFDHNTTAFPLEGKHEEIECKACHEVKDDLGNSTVLYKLNKLECIDCHLN